KDMDVADIEKNIAADSFLNTDAYRAFLNFRKNKIALLHNEHVDTAQVVHSNPYLYDAYRIAGDYCMNKGWYKEAKEYYTQALLREVATKDEREAIAEKIEECK